MSRMIPSIIHPDIKSNAEKRIFRLLENAPATNDWVILHSLGLARHQTKRRGEIDFVILCARGIFVLEVKGGRIRREGGFWTTQNRYGKTSTLQESPYEQASSAMFALEKDICTKFGENHPLNKVILGYGVLLPNTSEQDIEFGTDGDREITYCLEDMRLPISRYIGRLASFSEKNSSKRTKHPTPGEIKELTDFLRGDFDLIPPLWSKLKETEDELLELTKEQYLILDAMEGKPRILIRGAAGTGKTELARREVLTATSAGKRVLFLCYNRLLAAKLRSDTVLKQHDECVGIYSIYQYMDELIQRSPFSAEFHDKRKAVDNDLLYSSLYPEYASLALIDSEDSGWDMLVVDEGQDITSVPILDFLELCLSGGLESGNWRWFMDDNNQAAIYGVSDAVSTSRLEQFGPSHLLTINCRNTRQIHDETRMLTNPRIQAVARVNGLPVRYVWYRSSDDQKKALEKQIKRISSGGVDAANVVILSALSHKNNIASKLSDHLVHKLDESSFDDGANKQCVRYCTISAFKGLEADVVILTDITNLENDWWQSILYVGMSRAKVELVVLLPEKLKNTYNQKIRSMLEAISDED